jgi:hypothetical protein
MAGLAHMGVGLAAKPAAPKIPLALLIVCAYVIDILWAVFFLAGIEHLSAPGGETTNYWSHGLFMAVIWSLVAAFVAWLISRHRRTSLIIGLLVFSHWLLDFISHPMTAVFADQTGLPLFFEGSPLVGLGVWRTQLGVTIGEYGTFILGLLIYIFTLVRRRKQKKVQLLQGQG